MNAHTPNDLKRLEHIRDSLDELGAFILGFDEKTFAAERKTFLSSVKLIEIIGEASWQVSKELKSNFPAIPWKQIEGMRHRLVHEYYTIDPKVAWLVATVYAPKLRAEIDSIIAFLQQQP